MNIYFDTEFSNLFKPIEQNQLISIGFYSDDNKSLYLELPFDYFNISMFVLDNVIPCLSPDKYLVSYDEAREKILNFLNNFQQPLLVSDALNYDAVFLKRIIDTSKISFENIKFLNEKEHDIFSHKIDEVRISEKLNVHHALDDARANCKAYQEVLR